MAVTVTNPLDPEPRVYSVRELEVGVLYKSVEHGYDTVYVKTLQGGIVWFENGKDRIGTVCCTHSFIRAPQGTKVTLEQP